MSLARCAGQFYARPGTPAAKMKRVPNGVAKAR